MATDKNLHLKKAAMVKALEKTLGVVTHAAKSVGISRQSHYDWMKEDEQYKQAVEDIDNATLDFAESELYKQIQDGSTAATIFLLKTRGKSRGYIERSEIDHTTKGDKLPMPIWVGKADE
jgi:hypothetical protein